MQVVGEVPAGMPAPVFPIGSFTEVLDLFPGAAVLSFVSYVGTISLALAFAQEANEEGERQSCTYLGEYWLTLARHCLSVPQWTPTKSSSRWVLAVWAARSSSPTPSLAPSHDLRSTLSLAPRRQCLLPSPGCSS